MKTARRVANTLLVAVLLAAGVAFGVHQWLTETTDRAVDAVTPSISVQPALDEGQAALDKLREQYDRAIGGGP